MPAIAATCVIVSSMSEYSQAADLLAPDATSLASSTQIDLSGCCFVSWYASAEPVSSVTYRGPRQGSRLTCHSSTYDHVVYYFRWEFIISAISVQ